MVDVDILSATISWQCDILIRYALMEVWVLARIILPVAPKGWKQNKVNQSHISFGTQLYVIDNLTAQFRREQRIATRKTSLFCKGF